MSASMISMVALFSVLATIASEAERAPRARGERKGRKERRGGVCLLFVGGDDGYGGWGWGWGSGEGAKVLGVWKVKGREEQVFKNTLLHYSDREASPH